MAPVGAVARSGRVTRRCGSACRRGQRPRRMWSAVLRRSCVRPRIDARPIFGRGNSSIGLTQEARGQLRRLFLNVAPQASGNRSVRNISPAGGDEFDSPAGKVLARNRDEAALAQFAPDEKLGKMAPSHPLLNDLFLHELIAYRPAPCAFDDVVVSRRGVPSRVADDALSVVAHL